MKVNRLSWTKRWLMAALAVGTFAAADAQTADSTSLGSDSLIVQKLRKKNVKFSHDNSVTLLMSGQEKFDDMFEAIRQARSSIHLEYFNFRNDSVARLLFTILEAKAEQGVEVRALFDGFGNTSNNRPLKKSHLAAIRSHGVQIYEFNPVKFPWIDDIFNRDHRKIVVIDGQLAYTGGMNVADYYVNGTAQVGEWHDMHCRIEGEEVNTLQKIFLRMWKKVTGEEIHGAKYYRYGSEGGYFKGLKPDTTATRGQKMVGIINREPHTSNEIIREFYYNAINFARESIKIINPYFTPSPRLKRALRKAAERGVKVELMLSVKSDIPLTPDCGFYNAHRLMKRGVKVWMFKPGFHHTKIIMVDGKFCTVGSANLNSRSLRWDYEENAVIVDKHTTKELSDLFERQKKDCFLLTPESWNSFRTRWQKFRGWFANLLSPFL